MLQPWEKELQDNLEFQKAQVENMFQYNVNEEPLQVDEFMKSTMDELLKAEQLSGGRWVTINGRHVYIKGGKVEAGVI